MTIRLYPFLGQAPRTDRVVNEFLRYGGSEVRNKLLKILNIIFEKGEVVSVFKETLIKPVSVGSKLPSNMKSFRLRDAIDPVLKEEECGLRTGRGCVD